MLGAVLAVISLIAPRDETNLATASNLLGPLTSDAQLVVSFLIAAGLVAALMLLRGRWRAIVASVLAAACVALPSPRSGPHRGCIIPPGR